MLNVFAKWISRCKDLIICEFFASIDFCSNSVDRGRFKLWNIYTRPFNLNKLWFEISVPGVSISGFGSKFRLQGYRFQDLAGNVNFNGVDLMIWVENSVAGARIPRF